MLPFDINSQHEMTPVNATLLPPLFMPQLMFERAGRHFKQLFPLRTRVVAFLGASRADTHFDASRHTHRFPPLLMSIYDYGFRFRFLLIMRSNYYAHTIEAARTGRHRDGRIFDFISACRVIDGHVENFRASMPFRYGLFMKLPPHVTESISDFTQAVWRI